MNAYDRCKCRPGCLATLTPDDAVLLLDAGYALKEHLTEAKPDGQLVLDVGAAS